MYYVDLHVHSRFANATSPQLSIESLGIAAQEKGIHVIGTGDFTHPQWFAEMQHMLVYDTQTALFTNKQNTTLSVFYALTTEVALFYRDVSGYKRIHFVILVPSFEVIEKLIAQFARYGDLASDGRVQLMDLHPRTLLQIVMEASKQCEIIPAHIWTPWFGILGKRFGYDHLLDSFGPDAGYIHAIETGISSDPLMNWGIDELKNRTIVSFSDAHSLGKVGREATAIEGEISYSNIVHALRTNGIAYTIEYFPEEGKYHLSGHRKCFYIATPEDDLTNNGICPICHKKLTMGVYTRILRLSHNTLEGNALQQHERVVKRRMDGSLYVYGKKPFFRLIPLEEIIAKTLGMKNVKAKKVQTLYQDLLGLGRSEIPILLNPSAEIEVKYPLIYANIHKVLMGQVNITPGFDNTYGKIEFT